MSWRDQSLGFSPQYYLADSTPILSGCNSCPLFQKFVLCPCYCWYCFWLSHCYCTDRWDCHMLLPLLTYLFFNHGAPSIDQNGQWPAYNSTKFTKFCELWKLITPQELLIIHKAKPLLNMLIVLLKNKPKNTKMGRQQGSTTSTAP